MDLIDFLFPKKCLGCGKAGIYVCPVCISMTGNPRPICPVCEKPSSDGFTHVKCKTPLGIDGVIAFYKYEGVVRKSLIALKYKYAGEITRELVRYGLTIFGDKKKFLPKFDYLVPVPLHWYRENLRGFNQSQLLGRVFAEVLGIKYYPNLLTRKKLTTPQVKLKGVDRKTNILGAFSTISDYRLTDASCLLYDDVYTTGSTLRECSKVLKRKGVKEVWGLTLAR